MFLSSTFASSRPYELIVVLVSIIDNELFSLPYTSEGVDVDVLLSVAPLFDPRLDVRLATVIDVARNIRSRRTVDRPLFVELEQVPGRKYVSERG